VPGGAIAEDTADLALKLHRRPAKLCKEFTGKRPQTLIADFKADFGHGALGREHLPGAIHAEPRQEVVRSFPESRTKKTMEVIFGKTGLTGGFREQYARLIFSGKQIAPPAEAAEGVVMNEMPHRATILPQKGKSEGWCLRPSYL